MSLTALVFLLAFGAGSVMALARHPIYGLITYVGVFYVHPPSRWWGQGLLLEFRWSLLAAGITLLALLIHRPARSTAPVQRSGAFWGFVLFVVWIAIQSFWALDREAHLNQLSIYLKFIVVFILICKCIETDEHLRLFLWSHVAGCFYLGWLAFTSYAGGRLDGVGGPGIDEANAAGLQMVTGIMVAAGLFLAGRMPTRGALLAMIPIMVNGLVATISRSGFLAAVIGGAVFNLFTPVKYRRSVLGLSVLAIVLFGLLTNDSYWSRIESIKYKGEDIVGVDTGGGRREILEAQLRMFRGRPLGCGHMCTSVLSPSYLEERFLSGGGRASHNTFMSMLVDHGVIGAAAYVIMLAWVYRSLRTVGRRLKGRADLLASVLPAIAAVFGAITIGDLFVQYMKFEARIWFLALLITVTHISESRAATVEQGR